MRLTPFLVLYLSLIPAGLANSTLAHLPGTQVNDAKTDGAGNVYITGSQGTAPATHAFVAKLSPSGTVLYSTTLAGSQSEAASAIDIDSAGNAYVLGWSTSPDFPATPGALQPTLRVNGGQCFLAKVNPSGKVAYATFIGDNSGTSPSANGLVVNSVGEVLISGQTDGPFPSTPGAPFSNNAIGRKDFIAKIDATGSKLLAGIRGIGGLVALDAQGNAYVAGIEASPFPSIPTTPGAFQNTHAGVPCEGNAFLALSCIYQYVTKFDATLTKILYSTYLDGSAGATPAGISVDSQGNAWVAGTTNSLDYPITANAYQPWYLAAAQPNPCLDIHGCSSPPPPLTGFITQLNATGTGLIVSTFFGGSLTDTITFAALAADGIYLSGTAGSPDLPGFVGFPEQCLPQAYAVRMSIDAMEIGPAREVPGQVLAYDGAANVLIVWTGIDVVGVDPMAPGERITCILDAADLRPVTSIAPGELLSIFGRELAYGVSQASGHTSTSLGDSSVTINGITSPLLYAGAQQINLQVPFEIAGAAQAAVELKNSLNISDSRTLGVVASNPAAFVDTTISFVTLTECPLLGALPFSGFSSSTGLEPLTLNEDGTRNACGNPAAYGSVVRVFLEGLGVTSPPQATGATVASPGPALNEQVSVSSQGGSAPTVASVSALPGLISGVWQVAIRLPTVPAGASPYAYIPLSLSVAGVPVRDTNLTVWVHQ